MLLLLLRLAVDTARCGRGRVGGRVRSFGNAQRLGCGGSHNCIAMMPAQVQCRLRSRCHLMGQRVRMRMMQTRVRMRVQMMMLLLLLLATAAYGTHVALLALVLAIVVVVHVALRLRHIDILVWRIDDGTTILGRGMIGHLLLLILLFHIAIHNGNGNSSCCITVSLNVTIALGVAINVGIHVWLVFVKTFNATCKQLRFRIMRYHCGGCGLSRLGLIVAGCVMWRVAAWNAMQCPLSFTFHAHSGLKPIGNGT